jgi:MFS family permease
LERMEDGLTSAPGSEGLGKAASVTNDVPGAARFSGWRVAILGSIIQNLAIGVTYGGIGISLLAIQNQFGTNRATASMALSMILASVVLAAPILGILYGRISIRRSIILGGLLTSAGYALLTIVHGVPAMLACYGLLVGPGVAISGYMPCNVLVMQWFVAKPGRAVGVVNLPILITFFPLVGTFLLQRYGLDALYISMACLSFLIVPAALCIIDKPADVGQRPRGWEAQDEERKRGLQPAALRMADIVMRGDFWILVVAFGIITGSATMKLSHLVPLLVEQGHAASEGSFLLSVSGAAGILGSLLFGYLADRFGGAFMLMINAILQCAMWFVFLLPVNMALLTMDAFVIGACGTGMSSCQGVLLTHRYGSSNYGRVLGAMSLATLPFLVGIGPLAGFLHDKTGTYSLAITLLIVASGIVAAMLGAFTSSERRQRRIEVAA